MLLSALPQSALGDASHATAPRSETGVPAICVRRRRGSVLRPRPRVPLRDPGSAGVRSAARLGEEQAAVRAAEAREHGDGGVRTRDSTSGVLAAGQQPARRSCDGARGALRATDCQRRLTWGSWLQGARST